MGRIRPLVVMAGCLCCGAVLMSCGGCAPQLDRIELAVQNNGNEISRLRAENLRLQQNVEAVTSLL